LLDGVREAVKKFLRSSADYETSVNLFIKELQKTLIKSDVNVKLVLQLTKRIRERALKERPPPGASRRDWFVKIVYEELANLFGGDKEPELKPPKVPWVIMMVGVQGSGKTTTAGKLARFYKVRGYLQAGGEGPAPPARREGEGFVLHRARGRRGWHSEEGGGVGQVPRR